MPKSGATTHMRGTEPARRDGCACVQREERSSDRRRELPTPSDATGLPPHLLHYTTHSTPHQRTHARTLEERGRPLLLEDGAEAVAHVPVLLLAPRQLQPRLDDVGRGGGPRAQRPRDAAGAEEGADAGFSVVWGCDDGNDRGGGVVGRSVGRLEAWTAGRGRVPPARAHEHDTTRTCSLLCCRRRPA